ncbi:MAG: alpha/beta hydrolase [Planctomycetota bacterium]
MRAILYVTLSALALLSALPAQRRGRRDRSPREMQHFTYSEERFDSEAVGRRMPYGVYLPKGYDDDANKQQRWPLIVWLHGMWEDHNRFHSRGGAQMLDKAVSEGWLPPCVFVTANGGRSSMYMNRGKERWQDLISDDLLKHVCASYRVREQRDGRALMGVSMGGMGALRIAFTEPELFGAVAVHSSAVFAKDPDDMPARLKGFAGRLGFGDPIDKQVWKKVNPTCIADRLDEASLEGLRIYFDAGSDDRYGFDSGNKLLHACLEQRGIPHRWRLVDGGGHSWGDRFQDQTLPNSFRFVGAMFRGEPARPAADGKGGKARQGGDERGR